jgi:hypothetical protein
MQVAVGSRSTDRPLAVSIHTIAQTKAESKKQMAESSLRCFVRRNERKGFDWLRVDEKVIWSVRDTALTVG